MAFLRQLLASAQAVGSGWLYALYLVLGAVRGFTLLPSTTLVIAALPFFPPGRLFAATLAGIGLSSASIYWLSSRFKLDERLARRHPERTARVLALVDRYEFPLILAWSFFPLAPTDLICYACGVLRVRFWRFLAAVMLGEGGICAVYIFGGDQLLRWAGLR